MKLSTAGLIATAIVIVFGVLMIAPIFARTALKAEPLKVVLIFNARYGNSTAWCEEIGSYLAEKDIHATAFITGAAAEQSPRMVTAFKDGVDVGSMTYDYINITSIDDYTLQLSQIAEGKQAVESAGKLISSIFTAPYEAVTDDIYSQLNRVGVLADFSYNDHYNKLYEGQFIRMELPVYDYARHTPDYYLSITDKREPVAIRFDDSTNRGEVIAFIAELASGNVHFLNASELTGLQLTTRR